MLSDPDQFNDIREGVRAVCAEFPDEYHRKIDHDRTYPEAFVAALTKAGWMAADIHGQAPTRFSFRGRSPIFDDAPFMLHATEDDDGLSLWTAYEGGPVAMQAKAGWS